MSRTETMSRAEPSLTQVLEFIDASSDDLARFLSHYVKFASINPDMIEERTGTELRACQEWLADALREWGCFDEVTRIGPDPEQPNVVARRRGAGGGNALLFTGHSDVVPVTDEQASMWTQGTPFGGEILDGRVCGRGAADMKGGNVAYLWAVRALAQCGVRLQGDIVIGAVSGEETGNHEVGVDNLALEGWTAPFAVLAEPTNLEICAASVGEFYFLIRVEGLSASLASRHLAVNPQPYGAGIVGVNAIDKMYKIQTALMALDREWTLWQRHPLMAPGNMNINFSRIHGGETYSAMADTCELTGSVLFNPSLRYKDVRAEFLAAIDGVVRSDYWLREHPPTITIPHVLDQKEPINVSPDHPGTQALARACERIRGKPAVLACTTATSDGNYLAERGQVIVTFGPGLEDAGVHGPNEFLDVADLVEAAKVYAALALEWCGVEGA